MFGKNQRSPNCLKKFQWPKTGHLHPILGPKKHVCFVLGIHFKDFFKKLYNIRVRIKRITIAKCNLFFDYRDTKEILLYYFCNTKLCAKHKKRHLNSIYTAGIMFIRQIDGVQVTVSMVNLDRWCLVDCFHGEFGVSTQIKVSNYCISKCKMFSTCDGLLVALWAIFLRFKIFTSIRTLACKSNNMQT